MSNELVVIENLDLVPFFTKGDNLDSTLERIEKEMLSFVPGDLSVKKNRDAVKAMITKVTSSKTYLEKEGKALAAEYKEIPKKIDANRKKTKDFLTELGAKVRQPLTEWEVEDKRIKAEEAARIEAEKVAVEIERDHELALLMNADFDRVAAERAAEEKRIEDERLAKEESDRIARENQIREEAEKAAKEQAEKDKLQLVMDNAHGEALLINRDINDAAKEAKRLIDEAEAEAKRQQQEKDRQAQAKRDADAAEEKRLADIEQAKQEEIQRQKDEDARIAADKAKREADNKHIGATRKAAKESLMAIGVDEEKAKEIVMAIHNGKVANVQINY